MLFSLLGLPYSDRPFNTIAMISKDVFIFIFSYFLMWLTFLRRLLAFLVGEFTIVCSTVVLIPRVLNFIGLSRPEWFRCWHVSRYYRRRKS